MPLRFLRYLIPSSHYVLLSLLFYAGLELIFSFYRWIVPLISILFVLLAIGILLVRIEEKGRFRITQAVLPVLAAAGLTGFALFLPATFLLHLYFVLASVLLFWLLTHATKLAYPTWNWTISTVVLFLDAATILGLRFHLYIHVVNVLLLIAATSFLISFQAIRRVTPLVSDAILIALAMAIGLTEIAWVLLFLPLHYVVQAGVIVSLYYVFFHIISVSYERRVERKDITEYALVGTIALVIILMTAQWK